jgi:hypothetical protein
VNEIFFYEGNQIHNVISSSGSGSDFLTSYGSDSGSTSQKVTVPTVPVPQHCLHVDLCTCEKASWILSSPVKLVLLEAL